MLEKLVRCITRLTALALVAAGVFYLTYFFLDERRAVREYEDAGRCFTARKGTNVEEGVRSESRKGTNVEEGVRSESRKRTSNEEGIGLMDDKKENAAGIDAAPSSRKDVSAVRSGLRINPPEDAEPPISVDWQHLTSVNQDIVGWLYMDGDPDISYPILQGETNETYLHMTYQGSYLYAGSIFLNATSSPDLSDPSSYIFGHNMKSGAMFGKLKYLMTQEACEDNPYFWILTPKGDYRYRIFAAFTTTDGSDVYKVWKEQGQDFKKWANSLIEMSVIDTGRHIYEDDLVVGLSTCQGSGTMYRNIIFGVLVSTVRPEGKGNGSDEADDGAVNEYMSNNEEDFGSAALDLSGYEDGTLAGTLFIDELDIRVPLYLADINGDKELIQEYTDNKDSAALFKYGSQYVIADHMDQAFACLREAVPHRTRARVKWLNGQTHEYICAKNCLGINDGYLYDDTGRRLSEVNAGGITTYTCTDTWQTVTMVLWHPDGQASRDRMERR